MLQLKDDPALNCQLDKFKVPEDCISESTCGKAMKSHTTQAELKARLEINYCQIGDCMQ